MLLWAVAGLFLLSAGLTLATGAYVRAAVAERDSRYRLAALGIAEREMERLKATPFASLPADGQAAPAWKGLDRVPQGRARRTLAPGPAAGMRQISVRVEWRDREGPVHAVELVALRSPHGE